MVAWGPIIGAGISAISSLFGDDDEKQTTTTINYRQMAKAAEKAGFNPLTAIRNGGSAGFVTTHHPALSMEDRLGGVFSTLGNALMSFDARADERAELENRLLGAQLEQIGRQNNAANRSWFGDVPVAMGARVVDGGGRPVPAAGAAGSMYQTVTTPNGGPLTVTTQDVPDDPESLLVGPILRFSEWYNRSRGAGPGLTEYPGPKGSITENAPKGSIATWEDYVRLYRRWATPGPSAPARTASPSLAGPSAPWRPPSLPPDRGW